MLRGLRQARTGFAQVLAAMALVALAVRALVPGGYMLAASNDSSFVSIVLCSGHEAVLDVSTGQLVDTSQPLGNGDDSSGDSDAPCFIGLHSSRLKKTKVLQRPVEVTAHWRQWGDAHRRHATSSFRRTRRTKDKAVELCHLLVAPTPCGRQTFSERHALRVTQALN